MTIYSCFLSLIPLPRERSTRRALLYAALIHLILLIVLLYGMRWKNRPSAGAQAELWSTADTLPSAQQRPPSIPAASPTPAQPVPAEITLERARRHQQEEALRHVQQQEQEKQRLRQQQQAEQQRQAQKEAEQAEQRKVLQAQQRTAQQAKEKAYIEQQRRAHLEALSNAAADANADSVAPIGHGTGSGGQGSPGYADKVQQRVKPNLIFDIQTLSGNPQTVVSVQCAPDGAILNTQIVRPSGFPAWDHAVLRAVQKSDPMPKDIDGRAPSRFTITFRPKN